MLFVSCFELSTISHLNLTDPIRNKQFNFLKILAWSILKNLKLENFILPFCM